MKRTLMLVILLCLLCSEVLADSVKVTWQQDEASKPYVDRYIVYMGDSPTTGGELLQIPYTGQPLTVTQQIVPPGSPGTKSKVYISIAAVSKNGNITQRVLGTTSDGQNYVELTVPYPDVLPPNTVILEVISSPVAKSTKMGPVLDTLKKQKQ